MDDQSKGKILSSPEAYARGVVEAKTREEAGRVLTRMKDSHDSDSMPRLWTRKEDIRAITKTALRLDDDAADNIENTLSLVLMDSTNAAAEDRSITTADPLASSTWQEVSSSKTLITPVQCKSLCRQFKRWTEHSVSMAVTAQLQPLGLTTSQFAMTSVFGTLPSV
ncbi:hypothetical protein CerSpe_100800 [Prunus speciosa]